MRMHMVVLVVGRINLRRRRRQGCPHLALHCEIDEKASVEEEEQWAVVVVGVVVVAVTLLEEALGQTTYQLKEEDTLRREQRRAPGS